MTRIQTRYLWRGMKTISALDHRGAFDKRHRDSQRPVNIACGRLITYFNVPYIVDIACMGPAILPACCKTVLKTEGTTSKRESTKNCWNQICKSGGTLLPKKKHREKRCIPGYGITPSRAATWRWKLAVYKDCQAWWWMVYTTLQLALCF